MIFIGLGTNIGDKIANLNTAIQLLEEAGVSLVRISSFWETEPWGIQEQDSFLNAVAEISYPGDAPTLLDILLQTEIDMGRIREQKWGPRLIDLDILEFHREVHTSERLKLPHPYYPSREFVLGPLAELEPSWVPTGQTQTVQELLTQLSLR